MQLLLVEDDAMIAEAIGDGARQNGVLVDHVVNAAGAQLALADHGYSALLSLVMAGLLLSASLFGVTRRDAADVSATEFGDWADQVAGETMPRLSATLDPMRCRATSTRARNWIPA